MNKLFNTELTCTYVTPGLKWPENIADVLETRDDLESYFLSDIKICNNIRLTIGTITVVDNLLYMIMSLNNDKHLQKYDLDEGYEVSVEKKEGKYMAQLISPSGVIVCSDRFSKDVFLIKIINLVSELLNSLDKINVDIVTLFQEYPGQIKSRIDFFQN